MALIQPTKYFNLYYVNNTTSTQPLILEQALNIPFLINPAEYDVSIVRFSIPTQKLPLFTLPTATSPVDTRYQLTMKYGINSSTNAVIPDYSLMSASNNVWEIQIFIILLNNALKECYRSLNDMATLPHTELSLHTVTYAVATSTFTCLTHSYMKNELVYIKTSLGSLLAGNMYYVVNNTATTFQLTSAFNGVPTTFDTDGTVDIAQVLIPYYTYSVPNKVISLHADKNYYLDDSANPIYIGANEPLIGLLSQFPYTIETPGITSPLTFWYVIHNFGDNISGNEVIISQEALYLQSWLGFDSIIVTTTLPTQHEYQNSATSLPILSDFIPIDVTINNFHQPCIYNPQVPYRQYSLQTSQPIYEIKCMIYWSQLDGSLKQVEVGPGESASIKFMFTPRATNKYK
jgi:hypothetical protein